MRGVEFFLSIRVPCARDRLEKLERLAGAPFRFLLLFAGIDAGREKRLCLATLLTCNSRRKRGIFSETQRFFFAVKGIFETPELRSAGTNEHIKPLPVEEFIIARTTRRIFDF